MPGSHTPLDSHRVVHLLDPMNVGCVDGTADGDDAIHVPFGP